MIPFTPLPDAAGDVFNLLPPPSDIPDVLIFDALDYGGRQHLYHQYTGRRVLRRAADAVNEFTRAQLRRDVCFNRAALSAAAIAAGLTRRT